MTPNGCQSTPSNHSVDCTSDALLAEIDGMLASGKKIDAKERKVLDAAMQDAGFSKEQRGGILAAAKTFNRGGVGPGEQANLASLVESVAASNALKGGAPLGGNAGGYGATDRMGPMIDKLAAEIDNRMADGQLSPRDKAALEESLADAGFNKQSQHKVMDSIRKMMLDGLTETMKKRHDCKGGGDNGKAAAAEGTGGAGGGVSGSSGGSGGVSIGDIARVLGEVLNEQFKKLVDAANSLGSEPTAQQTAQLQALSAQVNANAGALTNAQRSAEEALKAIARA